MLQIRKSTQPCFCIIHYFLFKRGWRWKQGRDSTKKNLKNSFCTTLYYIIISIIKYIKRFYFLLALIYQQKSGEHQELEVEKSVEHFSKSGEREKYPNTNTRLIFPIISQIQTYICGSIFKCARSDFQPLSILFLGPLSLKSSTQTNKQSFSIEWK